jgi:hypothetical protein
MTADLNVQIARELCAALERLGADPELLSIVGSRRDTLGDAVAGSNASEHGRSPRNY